MISTPPRILEPVETSQRFASGMAFNPAKEMRLFSIQARKGQRLTGISLDANGWLFEEHRPEDPAFDLAYRDDADSAYFAMYEDAGWTHVLSEGRIHVFRAPKGTAPVPQAAQSRLVELTAQRNKFGRRALAWLAALAAVLVVIAVGNLPDVLEALLFAATAFPAVYVTIPAIGYWRQWLSRDR